MERLLNVQWIRPKDLKINMEKTFKSTQKYLLASPRKVRLVVDLIKKMKPTDVVEKLPFSKRRAANDLLKVVKSAIANAKNQGVSDTDLVFKEIQVGEGPRLKRGRAASRGRWHPFKRRMSHIRVVLTTIKKVEEKKVEAKAETKKEVEKEVKKEEKVETKREVEKVEKKGNKENGTKS